MPPEIMSSYDRAHYRGITDVLVNAFIDEKLDREEYGLILRAIVQRRQDRISLTPSRFPFSSGGDDAARMREILVKLEIIGRTPSGFYDEEVALEY